MNLFKYGIGPAIRFLFFRGIRILVILLTVLPYLFVRLVGEGLTRLASKIDKVMENVVDKIEKYEISDKERTWNALMDEKDKK